MLANGKWDSFCSMILTSVGVSLATHVHCQWIFLQQLNADTVNHHTLNWSVSFYCSGVLLSWVSINLNSCVVCNQRHHYWNNPLILPMVNISHTMHVSSLFCLSAAVRTVFSAPLQEAPTSSVCPLKEHCQWGVSESRVSVWMCLLNVFIVINHPDI